MDACCLNRPFDDLAQPKVFLEAEAIMAIMSRCESNIWTLLSSGVIDYELSRMTDTQKMERVEALCSVSREYATMTEEDEKRAKYFQLNGIKAMDSFHLAVAESSNADIFLTTDKKFLNAANRLKLKLKVANPLSWFMEAIDNE